MKLEKDTKQIVVISASVIGGIIIIMGAKKIVDLVKKKEGKEYVKGADKEVNKNDLTYNKVDYEGMASTLQQAMQGCGTDYYAIERIIKKLKTKSDWYMLVKTFGAKNVDGGMFCPNNSGSLIDWLMQELSVGSEQEAISGLLGKLGVTL